MSFDSEKGRAAGLKGGKRSAEKRWSDKDPATIRDKPLVLTVASEERAMIDAKAAAEGISRTELIVRAVREYSGLNITC